MDIGIRADGLTTVEFEKFAIDLSRRKFKNINIHGFSEGKDKGIDGVDDVRNPSIVVQAKRWQISKRAKEAVIDLKKEIDKIVIAKEEFKWKNDFKYVIVTSARLTPVNLKEIREYANEKLPNSIPSDEYIIFSSQLDVLSRDKNYKDIFENFNLLEKDFSKILQNFVRTSIEAESSDYYNRIKFEYFVETSFLGEAYEILQKEHILLVQGPAGIGKTTTCAMLGNILLNNKGNNFDVILRSIEDINKVINLYNEGYRDNEVNKNLFVVFDDFLGRNKFDVTESRFKDVKRIYSLAKYSNNLFICLNSRTQILQDAKQRDDEFQRLIDDDFREGRSFIIDLSKYTEIDKANILRKSFERKLSSISSDKKLELSSKYNSLIGCDWRKIINHRNYYPRLAEVVVNNFENSSKDFFSYMIEALDKPEILYDKLFNNLSDEEKYILFILLKFNQRLLKLEWLKNAFYRLNLKATFDLEKSLKILDESWLVFSRKNLKNEEEDVDFLNPSIIDYLNEKVKKFPNMISKIINNSIYLHQLIDQDNFNDALLENWNEYLDSFEFIGERLVAIVDFDKYKEYEMEFKELLYNYDGNRGITYKAGWDNLIREIEFSNDVDLKKYFLYELNEKDLANKICNSRYITLNELDDIMVYIDRLIYDHPEYADGVKFQDFKCYKLFVEKKKELLQEYLDYDIIYDIDYSNFDRDYLREEINSEVEHIIDDMLSGEYDWRDSIDYLDFDWSYVEEYIRDSIDDSSTKDSNIVRERYINSEEKETIGSILDKPLEE